MPRLYDRDEKSQQARCLPRGPLNLPDNYTEMSTIQEKKISQEAARTVRKHDASNFDDYLVAGLMAIVILALITALILL